MPLPVSRVLDVEKPGGIDLGQAARYMGARRGADAGTAALLERWAPAVLAAAVPRAVCLRAGVADAALAPLWQGQVRRAGVGDVAAQAAADALASALTEQVCDAAESRLRALAAAEGLYLTGRFSPGYGDWPIAVQPRLAELLDAARRIGLCVTDTCLMLPRKSVTAVLGLSAAPVTGARAGCGSCALRDKCEYRKRGETCES